LDSRFAGEGFDVDSTEGVDVDLTEGVDVDSRRDIDVDLGLEGDNGLLCRGRSTRMHVGRRRWPQVVAAG